jgi:methyltransferase (TIGR00027 family)
MPLPNSAPEKNSIELTGFFALYFKWLSRDPQYWQENNLVNGKSTTKKPLFKDPIMEVLIGKIPVELSPTLSTLSQNTLVVAMHAIRHRFFNKSLSKAVKNTRHPSKQVLFLGAGFDTRPVRKTKYPVDYFEVDTPAVMTYKKKIFNEVSIKPNSKFLGLDYVKDDLIASLRDNGFRFDLPTHLIWEANAVYLSIEEIHRIIFLFKKVFTAALTLSFDYYDPIAIEILNGQVSIIERDVETDRLSETNKEAGIKFVSGIDDIEDFAKSLGVGVVEDFSGADLVRQFGVDDNPNALLQFYHCCTLVLVGEQQAQFNTAVYRYSFSPDESDILKYIKIREDVYQKEHSVSVGKDKFDNPEDVLVAKKNGLVIGGTRLSWIYSKALNQLPMEESGLFNLRELYPKLLEKDYKIYESSRSSVLSTERQSGQVFFKLLQLATEKAIADGCDYFFFASPDRMTKHFEKIIRKFHRSFQTTSITTIVYTIKGSPIELRLSYAAIGNNPELILDTQNEHRILRSNL